MAVCGVGTSGFLVTVNLCIKLTIWIEVLIMAHGISMSLLKRQEPAPAPIAGGVGGLRGPVLHLPVRNCREEPGGWGGAGWAYTTHCRSPSPRLEPTREVPSASRTFPAFMGSGGLCCCFYTIITCSLWKALTSTEAKARNVQILLPELNH